MISDNDKTFSENIRNVFTSKFISDIILNNSGTCEELQIRFREEIFIPHKCRFNADSINGFKCDYCA